MGSGIVQYIMQMVMLVDGGTIAVPIYSSIINTIIIIQYTSIISGLIFLILK